MKPNSANLQSVHLCNLQVIVRFAKPFSQNPTLKTLLKQSTILISNTKDFKMLAMASRLRKLQIVKSLIENRSYTTATITRSESDNSSQKKVSLYSRISPLGNPNLAMTPELDDWIEKGKKVRPSELKQIVHDLRKRKRYHHALEVSEWMNKKGLSVFTPVDHAVQIDLIGKVHGFLEAEKYFNALTDGDKNDKTYGALLHCYVRQRETEKSLSHFQKMKENGFLSSVTFNDIMCLYIRNNQTDKVPDLLHEMKTNGISPDNLSYRMCINSYGDKINIKEMENVLKEMENDPKITMDWNTYSVVANCYIKGNNIDKANETLKKAEKLVEKDGLAYNHLISLNSRLGNKDDVLRLWNLQKTACKRLINRDYSAIVKSLVRLGEFEEAEKAEGMLGKLLKDGRGTSPGSWGSVVAGYLKKGDVRAAVRCMEAAVSLPGGGGRGMYHRLLQGCINGGKEVGRVLDEMKADGIEEDEETKKILVLQKNKV
ncbi:unnamed protein product [Lactuca saligna]|uniref:Pentacotripeptide-repeat region of PRORP domain-containing protein n=1 Tax=Lactuca saligna TaxID=75948 RepID=A0AA36EE11_LACSI|nr:unnamed protein product [Lactuca saligna]